MQHYHVDPGFDDTKYACVDLGVSHVGLTGERSLYLWVILQALTDIGFIIPSRGTAGKPKSISRVDYEAATYWLLRDSKDFFLVCEMAGASPFAVRRAAREFMLGKLGAERVV